MVAGKKAVEMRYLVIAILALVGLGIAFVVFGGLASGAGGKANIQIGGANYSAPNVYEALMGIGVTFGACAPPKKGEENKEIPLIAGQENDVCWSPPAPRYHGESSPTFDCTYASQVTEVVFDYMTESKDISFYIRNRDTTPPSELVPQIKREGISYRPDEVVSIKDGPQKIGFNVDTKDKEVLFSKNKVVVKQITCSEVKPVDLQPVLSVSGLFLDFDDGEKAFVEVGYENLGDPEASCEGGKLELGWSKYNADINAWQGQGALKTWQLTGTCEGTSATYQFKPPEPGIYSMYALIENIPNEKNTNNNVYVSDKYIVAWKDRMFRTINSKASFASSEGQLWNPKFFGSSLYNSEACYLLPSGRDNRYVLLAGSQIVKINNQDTKGTMALAVSTLSSANNYKEYIDNIVSIPPAQPIILSDKYYGITNSSEYYIRTKNKASMFEAMCGWYYDNNNNNNAGDNSGQNSLTIFALNEQPNYACSNIYSTFNGKPATSLRSGENTVCWAVNGKKIENSKGYVCPNGKIVQKIRTNYQLTDGSKFEIKDFDDDLIYDIVGQHGNNNDVIIDLSNENERYVYLSANSKGNFDKILAGTIYCA